MTDEVQAAEAQPEKVIEVTDADVSKFFDSSGDKTPEVSEKAPEPVVAKEPEKAPEKKAEPPPEKYVPLNALHEERQRRKELAAELAALKKQMEAFTAPKPVEPPPFDQDPAGHLQHNYLTVQQKLEQLERFTAQQQAERAQQEQYARFRQSYAEAAQRYAQSNPDFMPAYKFWTESRVDELTEAGYPREDALRILEQEEAAYVSRAMESGADPAERIFAVAKKRGFAKTPSAVSDAAKMLAAERGQKTAGLGSGGKPSAANTPEALLEMETSDFLKNWDKIMKKAG